MLVRLHSQATTTPKVRADIQASDEPAWVLAERHGTTEQTVYKWRHRDSVEDRSHTPHRLQTTLTPAQEAVAVALRKALQVSLDDLLAVVREFLNPDASRSGLDRCLRRHGVGNLRNLKALRPNGVIINISRGATIDENALLEALETRAIAGAGLDVFLNEPKIDPRFLKLDNVVLQPHHASATQETRNAMGKLQRDNIAAFLSGMPLLTPVN